MPLLILLLLNFTFLRNAGELLSLQDIVHQQSDSARFCIYGDALHGDAYHYKLEGYRQKHPRIVAIGSSRVMQLRERFFAGSFYNLGGAMTSIDEGIHLSDAILALHTPDVVLLGVDFWWLSESFSPVAQAYKEHPPMERREGPNFYDSYFLFKPFAWLKEGKITVRDYWRTIADRAERPFCNIGVAALKRRSGFGPDGSYYYTDVVQPSHEHEPRVDFDEIASIEAGSGRFGYEKSVQSLHMQNLLRVIDRFRSHHVEVIVILPPFAPSVVQTLKDHAEHYGILADLQNRLKAANVFFVDASDHSLLSATDCEFFDGIHGGDVVFARLLLAIDKNRSERGLPPIGATKTLQNIAVFHCRAMAPDLRLIDEPDAGFLSTECRLSSGAL